MSTASTNSPTERSPPLSTSTIRRRVGSARTWKTSATTTYYSNEICRVNDVSAAYGSRSALRERADAVALVLEWGALVVRHRPPPTVLAVRARELNRDGDRGGNVVQRGTAERRVGGVGGEGEV